MLLGVNPYQARGTQTHAQLLAVHDRLSIAREYDMRGYDLTTSPNLSPTSAPNLGSNPNVTGAGSSASSSSPRSCRQPFTSSFSASGRAAAAVVVGIVAMAPPPLRRAAALPSPRRERSRRRYAPMNLQPPSSHTSFRGLWLGDAAGSSGIRKPRAEQARRTRPRVARAVTPQHEKQGMGKRIAPELRRRHTCTTWRPAQTNQHGLTRDRHPLTQKACQGKL